MDILTLFKNVAILILMIVPGFLMARCHLSTEGLAKGLANLVLYASQPALIIAGFVDTDFSPVILKDMLMVFLLSFLVHLLFTLVGYLVYRKAPDGKRQVLWFATVFTNAGYMGIPLLCALLGPGAALYGSVYLAAFNIFIWSVGRYIYSGDRSYMSVKKMLLNPATVSVFIGLVIFLLSAVPAFKEGFLVPQLRDPGSVLGNLMNSIKALVAPLSMIVIGLRLAEIRFRSIFADVWLYVFIVVAMLLCPLLSYLLVKAFAGLIVSDMIPYIIVISAAAPAATASSMFAEKLGGDAHYSGILVSVSSILCVATIPLISFLPL